MSRIDSLAVYFFSLRLISAQAIVWCFQISPRIEFDRKTMKQRLAFRWPLLLAMILSLDDRANSADVPPVAKALLVGCTDYEFSREHSLKGPANDVALMSALLVERFGFDRKNIRILVEGGAKSDRPTRANIVREIESLIREARAGQKMVLFFAGHGCQQPDQNPPNPSDPEPDGLDEVFLPADIGPWSAEIQTVRNAIVDDEFSAWAAQLLQHEVELLVIFDSCHSGSGLRGVDEETSRQVKPEVLIPPEVLAKARSRSEVSGDAATAEPAFDPLAKGNWVAIYAAQPEQVTIETKLPKRSSGARPMGLLTYTLCQALREGPMVSYRELIQRIRAEYMAQGRYSPTPMIEGNDLDRHVLGTAREEPRFPLERDANGEWIVRAGQLHGLTNGSILAVHSAQANDKAASVGHVKVVDAGLAQSKVSPCAYRNQLQKDDLPVGGLCRPVFVDFGDLRLRVAIEKGKSGNEADELRETLRSLVEKEDSPVTVVEDVDAANWFVTRRGSKTQKGSGWILSPHSTHQKARGLNSGASEQLSEVALGNANPAKVEDILRRLNRATNLLALAARLGGRACSDGLNVELNLLYRPSASSEFSVLPIDRLPTMVANKGTVKFRVTNRGSESVDFTILFVDSQFGIATVFPRDYASDNRLGTDKSFETRPMPITATTVGREHLVLIAIPSGKVPVNFAFLAQSSLAAANSELAQARGGEGAPSAFESLLKSAAWGGASRGIGQTETQPVIQTLSWIVQP